MLETSVSRPALTIATAVLMLAPLPAAALDLFSAFPKPAFMTSERCPRGFAAYSVEWTANMANERAPSGQPTLAYAVSNDGPALPVGLSFGGLTRRFEFDSPRVGGLGSGFLEISQNLARHDEYTTIEITFDRDVLDLQMDIHDLDESLGFANAYSDRVVVEGKSWAAPAFHFSPYVVEADKTVGENNARRKLNERLGRPETESLRPILKQSLSRDDFAVQTIVFAQPTGAVRMVFGSDPALFPDQGFGTNPAPQGFAVADTSFCAAVER